MQPIKCIIVAVSNKNMMHVERKKSINKISATSDPAQWQLLCSILFPPAWWNMHVCPGELSPKHSLLLRWKTGLISVLNIWRKAPWEDEATVWHTAARSPAGLRWSCMDWKCSSAAIKICCSLNRNEPRSWGIVALPPLILFFLFFANSGCLLWIKRLWKFTLSALPGCSLPSQAWMIQIRLQNCFKTEP